MLLKIEVAIVAKRRVPIVKHARTPGSKTVGFRNLVGVVIAPVSKKLAVKMTNTYSAQLLLPLSLQWVLYLEQRRHIKKTSVQTKQKYGPIYYCKRIEKCIQLFFESR